MHEQELATVFSAAIAPGSTAEQRRAAADLCRALLIALEATPGQPLTPLAPTAPAVLGNEGNPDGFDEPISPEDPTEENPPVAPGALAPAEPTAAPMEPRRTAPFPAPTLRPPAADLPITPQAVASFVEAARNVPTETLLDLAISHVRGLVASKGHQAPTPSAPVRFHLVPLPPKPEHR